MKTLPAEHPSAEQEEISKKIEEMLSTLKGRNKLIINYFQKHIEQKKTVLAPTVKKHKTHLQ